MTGNWKPVEPESLDENVFRAIGKEWMLISAGTPDRWNTMTASWGALGVLWGRNTAFCFVRPVRYTYGFMEESERYTLSFFPGELHGALEYCGSHSGRKVDKAAQTGLSPVRMQGDTVSFLEARLVLVCRKLYHHDLDPLHFLDPSIDGNYPSKDYHRMYVGEIEACLSKM